MTRRAKGYFSKRKNLKLMYGVLAALKKYVGLRKRNKVNVVDQELQALRFYAFNLQQRHLKAWRKEVLSNKKK